MSREYPKIKTLYTRGDNHAVTDTLSDPAFAQIATWLVTEKIDGTNIRITFSQGENGTWGRTLEGRTSRAQIPATIVDYVARNFPVDQLRAVCIGDEPYEFTLYGEGYGAGIQKGGGNYLPDGVGFALFDVLVSDQWWLDWAGVCDVAGKLGVETVPGLYFGCAEEDITNLVGDGFYSRVGTARAEGVVARTDPYLYSKDGNPIKFKLKTRDFVAGKR